MTNHDTRQQFLFDGTDIRGEITSLSGSYKAIVNQQQYPDTVARLFGQFLVAASLLSARLKYSGIVTIQAMGNGALTTVMAECAEGSKLRGIVRGEFDGLNKAEKLKDFLGSATLAITIEPENGERYQGIVPMDADNLSDCLEHYFNQSEQLPTLIKISADTNIASGVMVQQMPSRQAEEKTTADWAHVASLMNTLQPEEQLTLSHIDQLYRLFHEEGVRVFEPQDLHFFCSCSRHRTERALMSIGREEVVDIHKQEGVVAITCEFCAEQYLFDMNQIEAMFNGEKSLLH
jgi:molecular chaperone Hsp33